MLGPHCTKCKRHLVFTKNQNPKSDIVFLPIRFEKNDVNLKGKQKQAFHWSKNILDFGIWILVFGKHLMTLTLVPLIKGSIYFLLWYLYINRGFSLKKICSDFFEKILFKEIWTISFKEIWTILKKNFKKKKYFFWKFFEIFFSGFSLLS